jgi:hypothetical protein
VFFGLVSSRPHVCWALAVGSTLEDRPAYATKTCFDSFPFPAGLTPDLVPTKYTNPHAGAIALAARHLNDLRDHWLNPPEWSDFIPEVVSGYPHRIIAKPGHEADLKKLTLTNLYNDKPAWLLNVHRDLDSAVANAYGWSDYTSEMPDEEILRRLLALNSERSKVSK